MTSSVPPDSGSHSWELIAELFGAALDLPPAGRPAFVAARAAGRAEVEREVLAMLAAHEDGAPLLLEEERRPATPDTALAAHDLASGTRLGPWQIVALVGEGGMGEVYRAERVDGAYRQTAAIKVLRPGYRTAEAVRHFRVERYALARLVHPAIAAILDAGSLDDGRPYLVLQYVDGIPITRYCDTRGLDLPARLRLFVQVARAVEFAHTQLVIHRDLKPSNILIEADGHPRLLDFGIARLLDPNLADSLVRPTRPESRLLTPEHAAPEQVRGEACDTRTDVYGLGVLLYELLTGRTPFAPVRRSLQELERAVLETAAPPPSTAVESRVRRRALRGDLDLITLAALRKEPDRRYPSAAALADDVERYLAGRTVRAQPDRLAYRARKFFARNRVLLLAIAAIAALIVGAGVAAALQARRATRERDRAERERTAANEVVQILTGLFDRANPRKVSGGDTVRVAALLDEAEQRIEGLTAEPERQAALLKAVGAMRAARGDYGQAEKLLRRSAQMQWKLHGPDDLEAARTYQELARVVNNYRGADAARPLFDSSLTLLRRVERPAGADVHQALLDLAVVTPDRDRARALIAETVAMDRRTPGIDSVAIAERLHAQAVEQLALGRSREAVTLFEATLEILSARRGPDDPDRLVVVNNLSTALADAGAYAQAESLQRIALATAERVRAPADSRAGDHERLALSLVSLGQLGEAERHERAALALFRSGLTPDHPSVGNALRNLALIVAREGRNAEGLALLDSAIAQARASGGSGVPEADYRTGQQVPILLRLGRIEAAARAAAHADSAIHAVLPYGHPRYTDADRWMAMVAFAKGDYPRAAERVGAALVRVSEMGPQAPVNSALFSCLLGAVLVAEHRVAEARPRLTHDCPIHDAWGYSDPLITGWGRSALARLDGGRN